MLLLSLYLQAPKLIEEPIKNPVFETVRRFSEPRSRSSLSLHSIELDDDRIGIYAGGAEHTVGKFFIVVRLRCCCCCREQWTKLARLTALPDHRQKNSFSTTANAKKYLNKTYLQVFSFYFIFSYLVKLMWLLRRGRRLCECRNRYLWLTPPVGFNRFFHCVVIYVVIYSSTTTAVNSNTTHLLITIPINVSVAQVKRERRWSKILRRAVFGQGSCRQWTGSYSWILPS